MGVIEGKRERTGERGREGEIEGEKGEREREEGKKGGKKEEYWKIHQIVVISNDASFYFKNPRE